MLRKQPHPSAAPPGLWPEPPMRPGAPYLHLLHACAVEFDQMRHQTQRQIQHRAPQRLFREPTRPLIETQSLAARPPLSPSHVPLPIRSPRAPRLLERPGYAQPQQQPLALSASQREPPPPGDGSTRPTRPTLPPPCESKTQLGFPSPEPPRLAPRAQALQKHSLPCAPWPTQ
ncbi:unannotated protein [freshwater metagenome]|uniref:Unannotated protein n=1 Tax=freshwater metagenome TaxID=449393 RepID=A0A6J7SJ85_9ZZZZ